MALQNPAYVISAASHSAALYRQALQTLISGAGVVESGDLAITQASTPNMTVNVAPGMVAIPGTLGASTGFGNNTNAQTAYSLPTGKTAQGMYIGYQDGTVNLTISAADPTNPRIDLVVAAVQDAQYAGSTNTPVLQVITGTAAASPAVPAAPASSLVLAQIAVAANATSIVTANITDKRTVVALNGSITRVSGTSQYPSNPHTGDYVDDANLGTLLRWNGSAWAQVISARTGCRVVTNVAQAITASTVTTWNNNGTAAWTLADGMSSFASSAGGTTTPIVIPAGMGGLYLVGLSMTMSAIASSRAFAELRINGAASTNSGRAIFTGDSNAAYSVPINLNPGDSVGAQVFTTTAGNLNASYIFAYRISA